MTTAPVTPASSSARILKIIEGYWLSCCAYVAARLNIADILATGPKTVEEIAALTGSNSAALYRLMRLLSGEGIFEETAPHSFALNSAATALVTAERGSIKPFLLAILGEHAHAWGNLYYSVQTGKTAFDHYYGMDIWEYYEKHPDEGRNFMDAMTGMAQYADAAVTGGYDFSQFKSIVDIGGGNGALLFAIVRATPGLTGTVYDVPYVIQRTAAIIDVNGLKARCEAVAGNFFESVPEGADAYIMKFIIHDWHDEDAIRLLQSCRRAMKKGSKILVVDAVITGLNAPHPGKMMDVNMLVATGGKERTADEFRQLFEKAGLQFNRAIPLSIPDVSIVEGEKE